jgi:hypothetical protein
VSAAAALTRFAPPPARVAARLLMDELPAVPEGEQR